MYIAKHTHLSREECRRFLCNMVCFLLDQSQHLGYFKRLKIQTKTGAIPLTRHCYCPPLRRKSSRGCTVEPFPLQIASKCPPMFDLLPCFEHFRGSLVGTVAAQLAFGERVERICEALEVIPPEGNKTVSALPVSSQTISLEDLCFCGKQS